MSMTYHDPQVQLLLCSKNQSKKLDTNNTLKTTANALHTDIKAELMYLNNKNVADCPAHSLAAVRDSTSSLETKADTANGHHTDIKAELAYHNNHNVANCPAHSLAAVRDSTASLETKADTANGHHTDIKAELAYHNNHNVANCPAHSLVSIKTATESSDTALTSIKNETLYANNTGASGSIAHSLVNILSEVIAMGAVPTKSILDFETDFVSVHSGTIPLLNHGTGQYHVIGDDATIKQFKLIQMGEMGSPTYTVTVKVYSIGGGGVLSVVSTNTYTSVAPTSIVGMNSVNYLTNQPTTTGLVFHFPMDYSRDCTKGSGIDIFGGELVKNPKLGFRSFNSSSRAGLYTSVLDLGSYGNTWTIAFWMKVINQDPGNTYLKILSLFDTMHDDADETTVDGFEILLNNQTSYNTKPYDDYRVHAYDGGGTKINLTSATASGGSGTQNLYFDVATGKFMNTWTHVAFSRSAADTYHLYQDGVLVGDITTASTITCPAATSIRIGGSSNLYYSISNFLCDDLRFYSTAVSVTEIAKMAATSLSTASGGIALTDLAPNEISVSKNQLVGVEVLETTAGADTGCEKIQVQLVASA